MFIDSLDEIIYNYSNKFAFEIKNKKISKISLSDDVIQKYHEKVNYEDIKKFIYVTDNFDKIKNMINKYYIVYFVINNVIINSFEIDKYIIENSKILISLLPSDINMMKNIYTMIMTEIKNENIDINNVINLHNCLQKNIFGELYFNKDKYNILKIIEDDYIKTAETKYINIYVSNQDVISYNDVKNLYDGFIDDNYINETLEMMEYNDVKNNNINSKINFMFKNKILIPITDEMLRYNKIDMSFFSKDKTNVSKEENIYVKILLDNINNAVNNEDQDTQNESLDKLIENRKIFNINDISEIVSISRAIKIGYSNIISRDLYNELINIRMSAYINFKTSKFNILNLNTEDVYQSIRQSCLDYKKYLDVDDNTINKKRKKNMNIETRNIGEDIYANIVGIAININNIPLECYKLVNMQYYDDVKEFMSYYRKVIYNNIEKSNEKMYKIPYVYFEKKIEKNNKTINVDINFYKSIILKMFNIYQKFMFEMFSNTIKHNSFITNYKNFQKMIDYMGLNNLYGNITINNIIKHEELDLYSKTLINMFNNSNNEIKEKIINKDKLLKLPIVKNNKPKNTIYKQIIKPQILVCQHNISLNELKKHIKNNEYFTKKLNEFTIKYVFEVKNMLLCKSCNEMIDLSNYIADIYDLSNGMMKMKYNIKNDEKYEKHKYFIKIVKKMLEKISIVANLKFLDSKVYNNDIDEYINYSIEILIYSIKNLKDKYIEIKNDKDHLFEKTCGISWELSKLVVYEITDNVFSDLNDDVTKYKFNNLVCLLIILVIINLKSTDILKFPIDKFINLTVFTKFAHSSYNKYYINLGDGNINLIKYPYFCYVIYYLTGMAVKYNIWIKLTPNEKLNQLIMTETLIAMINFIFNKIDKSNLYFMNVYNRFKYSFYNIYANNKNFDYLQSYVNKYIYFKEDKLIISTITIPTHDLHGVFSEINLNYAFISNVITHKVSSVKYKIINYHDKKYHDLLIPELKNKILSFYDNKGRKRMIPATEEEITKLSKQDIENLSKILIKKTIKNNNLYYKEYVDKMRHSGEIHRKIIEYKYNKKTYPHDCINNIIENIIQTLKLSQPYKINIINKTYYLKNNEYVIKHNYFGDDTKNIVYLIDTDFIHQKNNQLFNKDVIYYVDKNITVYYDANTLNLLGYKSKDLFIFNKYKKLVLNHSFGNKLYYLGFTKFNYFINDKNDIYDILYMRFNNLYNFISEFNQILLSIYLNNENIDKNIKLIYSNNKINLINNNIISNISKVKFNIELPDNIDVRHYSISEIIKIPNSSNNIMALFYKYLLKLIKINGSIFVLFLIYFVSKKFDAFTQFSQIQDGQLEIFNYSLNFEIEFDRSEMVEFDNTIGGIETTGMAKDEVKQLEDDILDYNEEKDAVDMEENSDFEEGDADNPLINRED